MVSDKKIEAPAFDEKDAALFLPLCQFIWVQGEPLPLIYNVEHPIYTRQGINLPVLKYLQAVGLISLEAAGYVKRKFGKHTRLFYFNTPTKIQFSKEAQNQLDLGHVLLTDKGKALATVCNATRNQGFYEYVIERWARQGLVVSSILKRH